MHILAIPRLRLFHKRLRERDLIARVVKERTVTNVRNGLFTLRKRIARP